MPLPAFLLPDHNKSADAQARLLAAALEIFGQKGPDGATVREIAGAAGQNVAAIAYYFGNKERLYRAVLEGIVRELRSRLADLFAEVERSRSSPGPTEAEAGQLLKRFLREVYLRVLSRTEAVAIAQLLVREQLRPSAGFEVLYRDGFAPLHEALCFLVGTALGRGPGDKETVLRTHLIMGQVYFFAMTRQGILRRLRWRDLEGPNAEMVADLLTQHIDIILTGLSAIRTRPGQRGG
jgi:TetR/AcrR family transcriptional regulator, regulator of cefoperazone and chloramphenicol sensitivity